MACPNKSLLSWKLLIEQKNPLPYSLWDKFNGEIPMEYYTPENQKKLKGEDLDSKISWFKTNFKNNAIIMHDFLKTIGNRTQLGYMTNSAIHISKAANPDKIYHEAFHMAFRNMLNTKQRESLYEDAIKQFGAPTETELSNIKKEIQSFYKITLSDIEAKNLVLEEKMAENFMEYKKTEILDDSILSSINKFFKDLLIFIKSLISNSILLSDVYYILGESRTNNTLISKGIFRNPEQFKTLYNPNSIHYEEDFGEATINTINQGLTGLLKKAIRGNKDIRADVTSYIGRKNDDLSIMTVNLLKNLYKKRDDSKLSGRVLKEAAQLEENIVDEESEVAYFNYLEANNLEEIINTTSGQLVLNTPNLLNDKNIQNTRKIYRNIVLKWNTIKDENGNTIQLGWREKLIDEMISQGYSFKKEKDKRVKIEDDEQDSIGSEGSTSNKKSYSKAYFELDPSESLTEEVKMILSDIPIIEIKDFNKATGKYLYQEKKNQYFPTVSETHDVKTIYSQLKAMLVGEDTFEEKLQKLKEFANDGSESFQSVYRRFSRATAEEKLILQKFLTNHKINFTISNSKDGKTIDAASNSYAEGFVSMWRGGAIQVLDSEEQAQPSEDYLYYQIGEDQILYIHDEKFKDIGENFTKVKNVITSTSVSEQDMRDASIALGNLLWHLGMSMGNRQLGQQITVRNTLNYIMPQTEEGIKTEDLVLSSKTKLINFYKRGKIEDIIKQIGTISVLKGSNKLNKKSNISNFHDNVGSGIKYISQQSSIYSNAIADKISNPAGGEVYPVHSPTALSESIEQLLKRLRLNSESPSIQNKFGIYAIDQYVNNDRGLSLLFDALQSSDDNYKNFYLKDNILTKELVLKDKSDNAFELQFMGEPYILANRLIKFINGGNKYYANVAAAAAERGYMDFMLMPRITNFYKKGNIDALTITVINELYRIQRDKEILRDPNKQKIMGVNDSENGTAFKPELFGVNLKENFDEESDWVIQDYRLEGSNFTMSDIVDEYVNGKTTPDTNKFEEKLQEIVEKLLIAYKEAAKKNAEYFIKEYEEGKIVKTGLFNSVLPWQAIQKYHGETANTNKGVKELLEKFLVDFLIQEDVGRNEIVKLTFGSLSNFKSIDAFTKRTKLLTTPKLPLIYQSRMGGSINPNYSTLERINTSTFQDQKGLVTSKFKEFLDSWVNRTKAKYLELREKFPGGPYDAEIDWLDNYKAGSDKMQILDGFSIISMPFYRELKKMQSENNGWTEWEEEAYQNYLVTGDYVYPNRTDIPKGATVGREIPITAYKPIGLDFRNISGANGIDISKTAWIPITKGYTKNFPVLDDIRQRMELNNKELDNPYINLNLEPIHVFYSDSAKKGVKNNIIKLSDLTINGVYQRGKLTNIIHNVESTGSYGFPQFMQATETSEDSEINLGVQVKKNAIANVEEEEEYFYNAGTETQYMTTGKKLINLYHKAFEELINRGINKVDKELKIDKLKEIISELRIKSLTSSQIANSEEFIKAKFEVLKRLKSIIEDTAEKSKMSDRYLDFLDITIDEDTKIPRFTIPFDFPINDQMFSRMLYNLYNREGFVQHIKGLEAVQTPQVESIVSIDERGMEVDESLKFMELVDHPDSKYGARVVEAECMIRPELIFKYGLKEGEKVDIKNLPAEVLKFIGYRVPNQDKATTIVFRIKKFLDSNYSKMIVVPPQIVALMGSDFDVDKLFLIFPSLDETGNKVNPNYQLYNLTNNLSAASNEEIQNIIMDTIMAVWSNPLHLHETMKPSNPDVLSAVEDKLKNLFPNLAAPTQMSGGMYFNTIEANLQRSQIMRGMHSNGLSGRQVAIFAKDFNVFDEFAIKISGEIINTKLLKRVPNKPEFKENAGLTTDQLRSRYIHKHVDSTNDIEYAHIMNDNNITYPVIIYWDMFYGDTELLHFFLNQPIIREFTTIMGNEQNWNAKYIRIAYKKLLEKYEDLESLLPKNYRKIESTLPMSREDIMNFKVPNEVALSNFMQFYIAGSNLKKIFKNITPDTSEGVSRTSAVKSFIKNLDQFDIDEVDDNKNSPFYGETPQTNVLDQFYKSSEPAYRTSLAYVNLMNHIIETAEVLQPIENSTAFKTFKDAIIKFSGGAYITPELDTDIIRGIWSTMLVKEGSPLAKYFNIAYSDKLYKKQKGSDTLLSRIKKYSRLFPEINSNRFISKLLKRRLKSVVNFDSFYLDMYQRFSPAEKDAMQIALESLIFAEKNNFAKVPTDKQLEDIRSIGIDLVLHNLISNGFRQNSTNYMTIIPPSFLVHKFIYPYNEETKEPEADPISIIDYINSQIPLLGDKNYFDSNDIVKFFRTFGKILRGNNRLLQRYNTEELETLITIEGRENTEDNHMYILNPPPFLVINKLNSKESSIYMLLSDRSVVGEYVTYLNMNSTSDKNNLHWYGGAQLNPNPQIKIDEEEEAIFLKNIISEQLDADYEKIKNDGNNISDISQICNL